MESYKLNFPDATVIHSSCGAFLHRAVELCQPEHKTSLNSDKETMQEADNILQDSVPREGQVHLVASGSPCQVRITGTAHTLRMEATWLLIELHMLASNAGIQQNEQVAG